MADLFLLAEITDRLPNSIIQKAQNLQVQNLQVQNLQAQHLKKPVMKRSVQENPL